MSFHVLAKFIVAYAEMLQPLRPPDPLPWLRPWTPLEDGVPRPPNSALAPKVPPQTPPMVYTLVMTTAIVTIAILITSLSCVTLVLLYTKVDCTFSVLN